MADLPLDQIVDQVRAALHGKRAPVLERVQRIERALAEYGAALEEKVARDFAREHALPQPKGARDVVRAAMLLRDAVLALPELEAESADAASEQVDADPVFEPEPASVAPASHAPPLVVVGGVPRPERARALPKSVAERIEWIDTTRQGTVAIGNLTQRLRARRVGGLVLLEGVVGHRHSDPLVSAARDGGVPVAYAGKGGKGALERALAELIKRST
jgi:hypothetical protein